MRAAAVIPARGGSKEVPRKNLRPFCGKPLLYWSIKQALAAESVDRVYVSTEDDQIASVAEGYGASVIARPEELAGDDTPLDPVMVHAARQIMPAPLAIVTLQPTCPIRRPGLIDECLAGLDFFCADSIFTVYEGAHFTWAAFAQARPASVPGVGGQAYRFVQPSSTGPRVNRQQIKEPHRVWLENGAVFATMTGQLLSEKARICGTSLAYEMDRWESLDIDSCADFAVAEILYRYHEALWSAPAARLVNCHGHG